MCRSAFSILQMCNMYAVKETHKLSNGFMIHLKISGLLKIEMENMTMNTNLGGFFGVSIAICKKDKLDVVSRIQSKEMIIFED